MKKCLDLKVENTVTDYLYLFITFNTIKRSVIIVLRAISLRAFELNIPIDRLL